MRTGSESLVLKRRCVATLMIASLFAIVLASASLAAQSRTVDDSARLHLDSGHGGSNLNESGAAKGTLPGTVTVSLALHTRTATATFTIDVQGGGSISGKGTSKLNTGKGGYASFGGSIAITGGTGKYAHASGTGGLYGTINRVNDSMSVTVSGRVRY